MFDDLLPKEEEIELLDLSDLLENLDEEEKYEICDKCDNILTDGEVCDCEDECKDDCGCIGVGCLKP